MYSGRRPGSLGIDKGLLGGESFLGLYYKRTGAEISAYTFSVSFLEGLPRVDALGTALALAAAAALGLALALPFGSGGPALARLPPPLIDGTETAGAVASSSRTAITSWLPSGKTARRWEQSGRTLRESGTSAEKSQ